MKTNILMEEHAPTISHDEQIKYLKLAQQNNKEAQEILIKSNIKLIMHSLNKKNLSKNYEYEDLVSVGAIGLYKAIMNFDITSNIKFSTFAIKCIDNSIYDYFKKSTKSITPSIFLDAPVDDSSYNTLKDIMPADTNIIFDYELKEEYQIIDKLVPRLKKNEQYVINHFYGFNGCKMLTQKEIAQKLKVSPQRITCILATALRKLRNYLYQEYNLDTNKIEVVTKKRTKKQNCQ